MSAICLEPVTPPTLTILFVALIIELILYTDFQNFSESFFKTASAQALPSAGQYCVYNNVRLI